MLLAVVSLGGCGAIGYLGYLIAPDMSKKDVKAEFAGLAGQRVAIVVFAGPDVLYDYPYARYELGASVKSELEKNVKGISVVSPRTVLKFQDETIDWEAMPRTEIGRKFDADYVLYIAVIEYQTQDPGSVGVYHGKVVAETSLYDTAKAEASAVAWRGSDIHVNFTPRDASSNENRYVRSRMQSMFADALAKRFYDHKEVQEEEGRS